MDAPRPAVSNIDPEVVKDFGNEWRTFNQSELNDEDLQKAFDQYFHIFPFDELSESAQGFDMGCGSGRWAKLVAPKVGVLTCIDPSAMALEQARDNLKHLSNVQFECAGVSDSQLADQSQDFGYCLGVLHHIPDTLLGIKSCAAKLKLGAPFLLYLYYRFDNKPVWFRMVWQASDLVRRLVCALPFRLKLSVTQCIALGVYWPLARLSAALEKLGMNVENIPLSDYRKKPLYFLKTDALDRFGTKLEKRFTKAEIEHMLIEAGFTNVRFSPKTPYWVSSSIKK